MKKKTKKSWEKLSSLDSKTSGLSTAKWRIAKLASHSHLLIDRDSVQDGLSDSMYAGTSMRYIRKLVTGELNQEKEQPI